MTAATETLCPLAGIEQIAVGQMVLMWKFCPRNKEPEHFHISGHAGNALALEPARPTGPSARKECRCKALGRRQTGDIEMGLLDQVLGGLGGSETGPVRSVLTSVLGGGQQAGSGAASQIGGQTGGLGGLISRFEQAGLGEIVQSWIGNGANQPVSPEQLHNVLGDDQVKSMADQSGTAPRDLLSLLSRHLPNAVNAATPNGRVPDDGNVSI
jgi:uncharacterized protein YidB (DUF937 family)